MTPEDDAADAHQDEAGRFGDRTVHAGRAMALSGGRDEGEMFPQRPAAGDPLPHDARIRPVRAAVTLAW